MESNIPKVTITRNGVVVASSTPDWEDNSQNYMHPDALWGEVDGMIFDGVTETPTVHKMLRHILWVNKIRIVNNILYFYDELEGRLKKIEEPQERLYLFRFFSQRVQQLISSNRTKEVIFRLKNMTSLQLDLNQLNSDRYLINLRNGVLDINNLSIQAKNFAYHFTYCLNAEYISSAKWEDCPHFQKFCMTSLGGDENKIELLLQILGYLWSQVWGAKVAFMFIGEANCGKSVILDLMKYIWGNENVSNIPLHKLGDRFNLGAISNKAINICSEIKATPVRGIDIFKGIVSGDTLSGEYKGRDIFSFQCKTKLLFAGNIMPPIAEMETGQAFLSRLCFLIFPSSITKEKRDLQLLDHLIAERNYIFSLAVNALKRLMDNNLCFVVPEDTSDYMQDYSFQQNHMQRFADDYCYLDYTTKTPTYVLYNAYSDFCHLNSVKAYSITQFSQYFKQVTKANPSHFRFNGKTVRGYVGIAIRETK